jgi:hypothetical protein
MKPYKVLEVQRHAGSDQMHGCIGFKPKHYLWPFADRHFKHGDRLDDIELSKHHAVSILRQRCWCLHGFETFEQVRVPKIGMGGAEVLEEE